MKKTHQHLCVLVLVGGALLGGCSDGDRQETEKMKMKTKGSIFDKPFDTELYEKNKAERIEMEKRRDADVENLKEKARAKALSDAEGAK